MAERHVFYKALSQLIRSGSAFFRMKGIRTTHAEALFREIYFFYGNRCRIRF
jgi:hypothetical protein